MIISIISIGMYDGNLHKIYHSFFLWILKLEAANPPNWFVL